MDKISRRDFLKKFAALAAAGTMGFQPIKPVDVADDPEPEPPYIDTDTKRDICDMCELEPWSCVHAMYYCHKDMARHRGEPVEITRYDCKTGIRICTGMVYP